MISGKSKGLREKLSPTHWAEMNELNFVKPTLKVKVEEEKDKREKRKEKREKRKCGERGSNTRPSDLQSDALPTELSPQTPVAPAGNRTRVCTVAGYYSTTRPLVLVDQLSQSN